MTQMLQEAFLQHRNGKQSWILYELSYRWINRKCTMIWNVICINDLYRDMRCWCFLHSCFFAFWNNWIHLHVSKWCRFIDILLSSKKRCIYDQIAAHTSVTTYTESLDYTLADLIESLEMKYVFMWWTERVKYETFTVDKLQIISIK